MYCFYTLLSIIFNIHSSRPPARPAPFTRSSPSPRGPAAISGSTVTAAGFDAVQSRRDPVTPVARLQAPASLRDPRLRPQARAARRRARRVADARAAAGCDRSGRGLPRARQRPRSARLSLLPARTLANRCRARTDDARGRSTGAALPAWAAVKPAPLTNRLILDRGSLSGRRRASRVTGGAIPPLHGDDMPGVSTTRGLRSPLFVDAISDGSQNGGSPVSVLRRSGSWVGPYCSRTRS